jgi:TPR repeat protein
MFRKSAEQGYAHGQYNVGFFYENGRGVAKDPEAALRWYRLAAAQNHDAALKAVARLDAK